MAIKTIIINQLVRKKNRNKNRYFFFTVEISYPKLNENNMQIRFVIHNFEIQYSISQKFKKNLIN